MAEMRRRTSRGRQKVELVKMENEANLLVTFSKRRKGIYKKVHELCSLTGAKAAIIGLSPNNKPFSFGCPDVPSILAMYNNSGPLLTTPAYISNQLDKLASLEMWNDEIMSLEEKLREENKRAKTLNDRIKQREKYWWESPIEELTLKQAKKFKTDLQNLFVQVSNCITNLEIHDQGDYRVPTIDFHNPQYATNHPSSINGSIFADGASSSTMTAGCSSNQIPDLNPVEMESASGGALEFAGPSTVNMNLPPFQGGRSSIDLPMALGSSADSLFTSFLNGYGHDESEFLKLCFD